MTAAKPTPCDEGCTGRIARGIICCGYAEDVIARAPTLAAENARLRGALEKIAHGTWASVCADAHAEEVRDLARAALRGD